VRKLLTGGFTTLLNSITGTGGSYYLLNGDDGKQGLTAAQKFHRAAQDITRTSGRQAGK